MKPNIVPASFFRQDALMVAPALPGMHLVRVKDDGCIIRAVITETEAYRGEEDLACHARFGKTNRNAVMYEPGGILYVYLIYGMYQMLNIVTGCRDHPQAVLIRAIEGANGPGKLTRFMDIDRSFNGEDLSKSGRIWLEQGTGKTVVSCGPRIGIDYASDPWKSIPWRFIKQG